MPIALTTGPDGWSNQTVKYCGHEAVFQADVYLTPLSVTVIAKYGKKLELKYSAAAVKQAAWHITDELPGTYWNPGKGLFIIPREAVTRLQ